LLVFIQGFYVKDELHRELSALDLLCKTVAFQDE
jgi:hypothetical protein